MFYLPVAFCGVEFLSTDEKKSKDMTRLRLALCLLAIVFFPSTRSFSLMTTSSRNKRSLPNTFDSQQPNKQQSANETPLPGRLEQLKYREAELMKLLESVRDEKRATLRQQSLRIGIVGFGRFGQFIGKTFAKHGTVFGTSRSDYTDVANQMGVTYVPWGDKLSLLEKDLDVLVFGVSILSFRSTLETFAPVIEEYLAAQPNRRAPLVVDVLSVKEHARQAMLDILPEQCDVLCTHPMFGPDSGGNGWKNLNFVYERTRIDGKIIEGYAATKDNNLIEGRDRIERFLSIWEEEGCRMVPMSCREHDTYAANSQFITHLVGRVLGSQGLSATPIDTSGFCSVLELIGSTTADSFDLFYGLFKFNANSQQTICKLQEAMNSVVDELQSKEREDHGQNVLNGVKTEATQVSTR